MAVVIYCCRSDLLSVVFLVWLGPLGGVSGALRAPGSGVSKKCPESVPGVSKRCSGHSGDTLGTLFGHSGARGPRDTPGTLRARRARKTPVAGRGGCNMRSEFTIFMKGRPTQKATQPNKTVCTNSLRKPFRDNLYKLSPFSL